ncbi:MAG TPA: hypothetical protein VJO34_01570 [Methylomirabilota bacterium]|nr:hypothetical protein [Methylomirabilota bacterium]
MGPDQPNRIIAYEVPRQPNSVELVSEPVPDGPVVMLTQKNSAVFPFGVSLGTTVNVSQTINYRQRVARYDPRKTVMRWKPEPSICPSCGSYVLDHYEFGPLMFETVQAQSAPFLENFDLVLDVAHNSLFGTEDRPYGWYLWDIAADNSGRLLGVVVVNLTTLRSPRVTLPVLGVNQQGNLEPVSQVSLNPSFPVGVNPVLWALIDLKTGEVVASTATGSISFVSEELGDPLPEIYAHFIQEAIGGGPQ